MSDDKKKVVKKVTKDAPAKPSSPALSKRPASAPPKKTVSTPSKEKAEKPTTPVKKLKKEASTGVLKKETKDKDATKKVKKEGATTPKASPKVPKKAAGTATKEKKKKPKAEKKEESEDSSPDVSEGEDDEPNHVSPPTPPSAPTPPPAEPTPSTNHTPPPPSNDIAAPVPVPTPQTAPKQDPHTRLSTLMEDCQGNNELLLDLYKVFTDYLKHKGVLPAHAEAPGTPPLDHAGPPADSSDPILQLYSSYPRRTSGPSLTLSLDGLNLDGGGLQNLSAKDKAALRAKAIERIKNIKERNSSLGSSSGGSASPLVGGAGGESHAEANGGGLGENASMLTTI